MAILIGNGVLTGKIDDQGVPIRCGDRVKYYETKPAYRETSTEDGWGRSVPLCEHDQRIVPAEEQTTFGTVRYSTEYYGFTVCFDNNLLGRGVDEEQLHMVGRGKNNPDDRLTVII